ncbi:PH domain-containing protein [Streptomyces sp. NPDC048142]|uniref:PH domain-containing protein n=1 Tax=Streptomyces sp. NPDC048142 TaxID=3365501 RepID=UPI00371E6679
MVVLAALCVRIALRGVVLRPAGVAVVGFLRTRRFPWQDIAEVELALHTGESDSGRWRIAFRLHHELRLAWCTRARTHHRGGGDGGCGCG